MSTRVLVIDDQKIPRLAVSGVLREAGHDVAAEEDGPAGIERARGWAPDVIILDLQMPGMDGFAVVEQLKRDPATEPIPVVFLTASAPTEELIVRGLAAGAYDFLSKGCSRAELLARVGVMARIKRNHDELAAVARVSDTLVRTLDPAELAGLFVEQIREVFRADGALLALARGAGVRYGAGLDAAEPWTERITTALLERLADSGAGVDAFELGELGSLAAPAVDRYGFHSVVAVRVDPPGRPPVLLAGFSARPEGFRRDSDAPLLRLLAVQALTALENALLHTRTLEQAERLELAVTERSRFFASMSHELRTPINAVIGYSQLLEDGVYGPLEDAQAAALQRVQRSAQHLLELVNDVLDISKIEAGKLDIIPQPVDLAELLQDTLTSVHIQASEKGLALELETPSPLPITTDPARLRQILLNLLSNAVKFTEQGTVTVDAALAGPEADAWVEIRVADTGRGISREDRERIFDEFEQVNGSAASGGTGLGLAISRRIASLLGGEITLRSELGTGSTFTVRIPASGPGIAARE